MCDEISSVDDYSRSGPTTPSVGARKSWLMQPKGKLKKRKKLLQARITAEVKEESSRAEKSLNRILGTQRAPTHQTSTENSAE